MFDHASLSDTALSHNAHSPSLPSLHQLQQPSPGSTSSLTLEPPASYDALQASAVQYRTRISELEVINDLYRSRVAELEQNERRAEQVQNSLRTQVEQALRREEDLKRRLGDLDREVSEFKRDGGPRAKRPRLSEPEPEPELVTLRALQYPDPPEPPKI